MEIAALKEVRKVKSIQIFRKPAQQAIQGMVVRVVEFSSEGSIFYVKNHQNFSIFFSLKNTNLGAHFLLLTFFDNIVF